MAGLALSFFLFGYALIYWRNADMDFMVIYNALAMNDGKPQHFFDRALIDAAQFRLLLMGRYGVYQLALMVLTAAWFGEVVTAC